MNAEQASALAREYAARMAKLVSVEQAMDLSAFVHAAFMQGWAEERKARLNSARGFIDAHMEKQS